MEAGVKKDQRIAEEAQPDMAAHPGLRPAHAPDRIFFAKAEQRGKNHEPVAGAAVNQADDAAAARAAAREQRVGNIGDCGDDE